MTSLDIILTYDRLGFHRYSQLDHLCTTKDDRRDLISSTIYFLRRKDLNCEVDSDCPEAKYFFAEGRSEPSSRNILIGEQPNPSHLLQQEDMLSRHRGAELRRRYELLGGTSLFNTFLY